MAGNAVIGALRVVLGADSAALEKGLQDAQGKLAAFAAGVAKAGAIAATAFVAAGTAVGVAVNHAINQADQLGKAAQKIGVPVEELSALKFAAELSDVSMETLTKSLGKLSKAMVEAAAKPTSEAALAFKALGVSVVNSDGTLKSSSQTMGDIAGKFEGLKDGAGKTAVSIALFGKAGAEMIPLLNTGKQGIADLTEEAAKLGIVIGKETSDAAEKFNDNLKRLGAVKDGIILKITAGMLPALQNLSKILVDAAKNTALMEQTSQVLSVTLQGLVSAAVVVGAAFKVAASNIATVVQALWQAAQGDFAGAWATIKAGAADAGATIVGTAGVLKDIWTGAGIAAAGAAGETDKATKALGDFNYHALAGKTALDQYIASVQKSIAAQQSQIAGFGQVAGVAEAFKVVLQGVAVAKANGIDVDQQRLTALYQEAFATQDLAQTMAGLQLTVANMMPWEVFNQALLNNRILLDNGKISTETFARANEAAADRAGVSWKAASGSLASSFGEIGQSMASLSSNWARMAKIAQVIGAAVAFINAYVAASEAFAKTPFPGNIAIAAGVLAKGMAMAAAIKSAVIPAAAMGGAFRVAGGVGGGDSVRAMIDLEPGELVEVSSNRPGGYKGGGAGGNITLHLHGETYGRKQVVNLIAQINDAIGDGSRIRMVPA
jgi:ribosomal protein L12E/L44/L45/RPP1/RPP2